VLHTKTSLAPIVVDDAWVDNRSSPVDRKTTEDRQGRMAAEAVRFVTEHSQFEVDSTAHWQPV